MRKYFPKPNDCDTEHDYYWYLSQEGSRKLAGLGGVFNAVNMDVYHYAGLNPVIYIDPDGETVITIILKGEVTPGVGVQFFSGYAVQFSQNGTVEPKVYRMTGWGLTAGIRLDVGSDINVYNVDTVNDLLLSDFVVLSGDIGAWGFGIGMSGDGQNNIAGNVSRGIGAGGSFALPRVGNITFTPHEIFTNMFKALFKGDRNPTIKEIKNFVIEINK